MITLNALTLILLWTLCGAQAREVLQPDFSQTAKLGDTVKIRCLITSSLRNRVWYKLNTSRRLQLIASTDHLLKNNTIFDNHFSVQSSTSESILRIMNTTWEDAGTYYCGVLSLNDVKFGSGTVLVIKGDSRLMQSVVQRPDSITVQPGDSVTVSCSFITSHCPEEHISVIWLKSDFTSEIIYWNNGNENATCESRADSGETTCVHNFTMKDLSSADDGTYLCVVTSCGQTLFGHRTRIHLNKVNEPVHLSVTVIALIVSNIVLGVTLVGLVWVVCSKHKKQTTEMDPCSDGTTQINQAEDGFTYARVNVAPRSVFCRLYSQKHRQDPVVYSEKKSLTIKSAVGFAL